jgi:hypothetical protein
MPSSSNVATPRKRPIAKRRFGRTALAASTISAATKTPRLGTTTTLLDMNERVLWASGARRF